MALPLRMVFLEAMSYLSSIAILLLNLLVPHLSTNLLQDIFISYLPNTICDRDKNILNSLRIFSYVHKTWFEFILFCAIYKGFVQIILIRTVFPNLYQLKIISILYSFNHTVKLSFRHANNPNTCNRFENKKLNFSYFLLPGKVKEECLIYTVK